MKKQVVLMLGALLALSLYCQALALADTVITDDLIVIGGGCIGTDCNNGENFGDDTLRLKENNTRIALVDTSSEPGYSSQDWWLIANDRSSGGSDFFAIGDESMPTSMESVPYDFAADVDPYRVHGIANTWYNWAEFPDVEFMFDDSDNLSCRDLDGNAIACPDSKMIEITHPEKLDFIVDPSRYTVDGGVIVHTNNGFRITEDAVIINTTRNDRTLSNVDDGVDSHDIVTVGQVNAVQTTLAEVEALVDGPTEEMSALDVRLKAAQGEDDNSGAITLNRIDIDALQVAVERYQVSSDAPTASATGTGSTALGGGASAKTRDIAIGSNSTVTADGSVAVGADTLVESQNSVAVGADSHIATAAEGGVALGQNAQVVAGASGAVAIGQNSVASEANTVSVGSDSNQRKVTHVAAAVEENDAINFSQLQSLAVGIDLSGAFKRLGDVDDRTDDVGAMTTAFSALIPNVRSQGRTQVSFGLGHYSGANALAAGMFHYLTDNVLLNLGVSSTFDSNATALQTGISWGW